VFGAWLRESSGIVGENISSSSSEERGSIGEEMFAGLHVMWFAPFFDGTMTLINLDSSVK
jgi:hypothetical protein